ncbi:hypothetical protein ACFFR3_03385 [Nonomuraea salmonea]|uniref:Uncharacterized protein n=2 Tax=Nonomuraea salmonea TaxID=46181 RepID=A0ABV5NE41_9ACTN
MHIARAIKAPLSGLACAATLMLGVASFSTPASATVQASASITTTQPTVTRAQAASASVAASRVTAPACIEREVNKKQKIAWITNTCGKTRKVKVVINNGPDTYCRTLKNHERIYHRWPFGSYDRTVNC